MTFPNYFADAESDFEKASFVIFGVPYEKTSSFRHGADNAPYEVRQASWNFETFDLRTGLDIRSYKVHDYGNLLVDHRTASDMMRQVQDFVGTVVRAGKFPVGIGGDHSITPGIVTAFPKDIAVLSLDAHMDFRSQYENDEYNHACVIRRIADHIPVDHIAVIGIRSAEKDEYDDAVKQGLFFRDVFTIKKIGVEHVLKETQSYLSGKKVYLTIDIDVVDPAFAPGTSTPEPFGLNPFDIIPFIEGFAAQLVGFDIVEVCPSYDHGQTALLAAKLIRIGINAYGQRCLH